MQDKMTYNRVFAQPAFWEFVSTIRNRDAAEPQASDRSAAAAAPGAFGGKPRRARMAANRGANAPAGPVTMFDAAVEQQDKDMPPAYPVQTGTVPVTSLDEGTVTEESPLMGEQEQEQEQRGGAGGFHKLRARLQAKGLSEEDITARIEKRRANRAARANGNGNGNGKPKGPRAFRMRLREKGLSEEEIDARIEKRRARRAARANGEGNAPGPRGQRMRARVAEADPLNSNSETEVVDGEKQAVQGQSCRRCRRNADGVRPARKHLRAANATTTTPPSDEKAAPVTEVTEKSAPAVTEQEIGGAGTGEVRHINDIIKGGPAKFAGRFNNAGANANNDNVQPAEHSEGECIDCGRKVRKGRKNAEGRPKRAGRHCGLGQADMNDEIDQTGNAVGPISNPKFNKMNRRKAAKKFERVGNKNLTPRADVFATDGCYIIQVPAPGAKLEDVAVTWDPEQSAVLVAGAIHRPSLHELGKDATLVRGQRAVGPFQKTIKLGKKNETVKVYENGITATLEDGLLTVNVPKYDGDDDTDTVDDDGFVEINEKY